jgi:hypothetical protein
MRSGWWLFLPLSFGGCSGGYPLEPTRCDDLCHVTQGQTCPEYYDPAACVVACERSDADAEPCRAAFDAVLTCFRDHPGAVEQRCASFESWEQQDCLAEEGQLAFCVGALNAPEDYGL